jgi:hypothetical protein
LLEMEGAIRGLFSTAGRTGSLGSASLAIAV